jgi:hypothetical protein
VYGSLDGVTALLPALGVLTPNSTPTDGQVTTWLSEASAIIDRTLSSAGWVVPAPVGAAVIPELNGLANLYAAAQGVMARGLDGASGDNESRSGDWLERFDKQLEKLAASNLTLFGISLAPSPTEPTPTYRRPLRTTQLRRIDGYARNGWVE